VRPLSLGRGWREAPGEGSGRFVAIIMKSAT
jgi:hypothetical protein